MKKQVVVGLGEIGNPIYHLISKNYLTSAFDVNPKLIDKKKLEKYEEYPTSFLHICIPFTKQFIENVILLYKKFKPGCIIIHSTIKPFTTKKIQQKLSIPIIYSATRGIHTRMYSDLNRYTKFFSIEPGSPNAKWATTTFSKIMKKCGIKTKKLSRPITLELAKILVDTSYYGWLINYAQLSNMIARQHNVDYDEMWSFSDEIHQFLGNRPKMFPGSIGGHCVIPNLDLIQNQTLRLIEDINNTYIKKVKDAKLIYKKYSKSQKMQK